MAEQRRRRSGEAVERDQVRASEVSWALRAVNRAAGRVDQTLSRRLQLRPLDYAGLGQVMDSDRGVGPAELSASLGISTGSATELADRLERDGHLRRDPHPSDRRRVVLSVTDEATSRLLGTLAPLLAELDTHARSFSAAEQEVLVRFLRGAAERMTAWAAEPARTDRPDV